MQGYVSRCIAPLFRILKIGCQKKPSLLSYGHMNQLAKKFGWHANMSSGGTLSLDLDFKGEFTKGEKDKALADTLAQCYKSMSDKGYIPFDAKLLSSRDIAEKYGHTRQYWEKLLNEGKIPYKETSAGRITTDLWVSGYLGNREEVDGYVRNVKKMLKSINESRNRYSPLLCAQCGEEKFEFNVNTGGGTNGVCRACNFYIHTINE